MTGQFEPAPFSDLWAREQDSRRGDVVMGAMWQSVLRDLEWGDVSRSRFLQDLQAAARGGLLSIKFNVDRYSMDFNGGVFCTGRIVGTIGPASNHEPAHFVVGRQLMSTVPLAEYVPSPGSRIMNCVAVLDEAAGKVRIDLGNALPTRPSADTLFDVGALSLVYPAADPRAAPIKLGGIDDYLQPGWYEKTAGVVELPVGRALTSDEINALVSVS